MQAVVRRLVAAKPLACAAASAAAARTGKGTFPRTLEPSPEGWFVHSPIPN